jgi:hypothetical protein
MSHDRVFVIAIIGYSLYLYGSKNLLEVRHLVRYLFGWLPFGWTSDLAYFFTDDTVLFVVSLALPIILFSGISFRIKL